MTKRTISPTVFIIYIASWMIINLFFLTDFPFMHTDEAWLASLSRTMMAEQNLAATESFFDLVKRAPHAVKILFHSAQILFIKLSGYSLFSIRLFALITGAGCLAVFNGICRRLSISRLDGAVLLSVQIQFIYASHFGRQEIQILFFMLLSIFVILKNIEPAENAFKIGLFAGLPIAIAAGFHPNAFIAALPAGLILTTGVISRRRSWKEVLGYIIPPAAAAVILILISRSFNSRFIADYSSFGAHVGVFDSFDLKLLGFDDFYKKLFLRVSGTYYTPRITPVFLAAAAAAFSILIAAAAQKISEKRITGNIRFAITAAGISAAGIIGTNAGILIIGKYSAPSVIFVVPFLVLLISAALKLIPHKLLRRMVTLSVILIFSLNSILMIYEETGRGNDSYNDFTEHIESAIPALQEVTSVDRSRVLGPLTSEFAFEHGRLLDWRNMAEIRSAEMTLSEWIKKANVEYIIYTEELDVIYSNRPVWNLLYGNPKIYHEQLQDFISDRCSLVSEFSSPAYGTRIVMHRGRQDWSVRVYEVAK